MKNFHSYQRQDGVMASDWFPEKAHRTHVPETGMSVSHSQEEPLEFYLVTTDHLTENIWFKDEQDFKVGMNYVAIISIVSGIRVLAFILMSNHVHLVLQCSHAEAKWFINELKRRYSEYLSRRYGTSEFLKKNNPDIQPVYLEDESFERSFAYTIMNSVAANISLDAFEYPWSSASAYFRSSTRKGTRFGDLSKRSRLNTLHSREILPKDILVGEDGYILPESFIPVKFVEALFRTPKRLNYFMMNSSKAKRRMEAPENGIPSFKDQVILAAVPDICRSLFRKSNITVLDREEMKELVRQVKKSFSADVAQIARVLGVPYSEVARLLEDF